jgi:kynurenine formamidase
MDRSDLPDFKDLPVSPTAPPNSAWGLWGAGDQIGTLNLLTDARTLNAINEVRSGRVINLNLPIDEPWRPPGARRGNPKHYIQWVGMSEPALEGKDDLTKMTGGHGGGRDDYIAPLWLQGSTQWDGLAHIRNADYGNYNGVPDSDIHGGPGAKLGIDQWAQRCVVGRGVLADVAKYCAHAGRPFDPAGNYGITVNDLQETLAFEGVTIQTGDILLLHTGWMDHYRSADEEYRRNAYTPQGLRTPGLEPSDDMLEYLWNIHIAAIAADNTSLEKVPQDGDPFQFRLHQTLLPLWGMAVGESWNLYDIAEDCERDGRYTFLLVSVPLNVKGGLGTPANAVAIK